LFSCTEKQEMDKNNILHEQQFINAMANIELAQAYLKLKTAEKDTLLKNYNVFNPIFDSLNITKAQYNTTLNYYLNQPKKMEYITNKVINLLSEKQAKLLKK